MAAAGDKTVGAVPPAGVEAALAATGVRAGVGAGATSAAEEEAAAAVEDSSIVSFGAHLQTLRPGVRGREEGLEADAERIPAGAASAISRRCGEGPAAAGDGSA